MKKQKPYISIIVPVYNAERYLKECLESLIEQTLKNIEIICVNDGSEDSSLTILEEYKKKYTNIKVINQKNQGPMEARITGYLNSTGEYIAFVDNDDFLEKNMYSILYEEAKKNNYDMVICNYNFYPKNIVNKDKWFKKYDGKIDYNFIQRNILLWNRITKKSILDDLNIPFLFRQFGEGGFAFVVINSKKIKTIQQCLYNYRIGHNSLSSNYKNIEYFKRIVTQEYNRYKYVKEKKYSNEWLEYFKYNYLYYCQVMAIIAAYNSDKNIYKLYAKICKKEEIYNKNNSKYYCKQLSKSKVLFFKYIGNNSYLIMKCVSHLFL